MKTLGITYNDTDGIFLNKPFNDRSTFKAYRKFSEVAKKIGVKVVVAKPEWYNRGKFLLCWNLLEKRKEKSVPVNFVFDRVLSFNRKHHDFMRNLRKKFKKVLLMMNDPFIEDLCNDKYLTHKLFRRYVPKTSISLKGLKKIKNRLAVVKPRFGAGGAGVKVMEKYRLRKLKKDYIVQEFVDTSAGIKGVYKGIHDLRLLVLNGKILDFYLRVPRKGLISNISLGGRLVRIRKIPKKVMRIANYVDSKFNKFVPRLYSIDFLIDKKQRPWIIELNSHPGFRLYYKIKVGGQQKIYKKICRCIMKAVKSCIG
ncbi:MAG: ATP-grasp domain-containing protein [Candidatus Aenigmarchaeota archaeon]|nr:ATP-grasp domain-containing protein [Candidatus Aenigmarchaeota archaeon]